MRPELGMQGPTERSKDRVHLHCDTTRRMNDTEKEMLNAFIFIFAISSPVAAPCIDRIVIAVADGVGKTSLSSRATSQGQQEGDWARTAQNVWPAKKLHALLGELRRRPTIDDEELPHFR